MATHIIFDLGNVLIHIHPELAMKGFEEACGIKKADLREFFLSDLHLGFMEGVYSTGEFFKTMMDEYPCSLDEHNFHMIWNRVIGEPKEGIKEIIEELKSSYSLVVCSNTDPWHWQKVVHDIPFMKEFSHYFLSFEMNLNKPDSSVFKNILSSLGVQGQDCVFIDDTPENVEVARRFGIHGIATSDPMIIRQELKRMNILK